MELVSSVDPDKALLAPPALTVLPEPTQLEATLHAFPATPTAAVASTPQESALPVMVVSPPAAWTVLSAPATPSLPVSMLVSTAMMPVSSAAPSMVTARPAMLASNLTTMLTALLVLPEPSQLEAMVPARTAIPDAPAARPPVVTVPSAMRASNPMEISALSVPMEPSLLDQLPVLLAIPAA